MLKGDRKKSEHRVVLLVVEAKKDYPMPADIKLLPSSLGRNAEATAVPTSPTEIERLIRVEVQALLSFAKDESSPDPTFMAFERSLLARIQALGRLLIVLFLTVQEARLRKQMGARVEKAGRPFLRRPPQSRSLSTTLGIVRYSRTYYRATDGSGFHPLDVALGLTADRITLAVLGLAARLATLMSFAQARVTLGWFLSSPPSTEVIEKTVLGLGRRTGEWFERVPAPAGDGEVLVVMIDSKGAPTATDTELKRRRGKRKPNPHPESSRHRGRSRRTRYGKKPRRKKGDKSKNARMATLVVMYTLKHAADGTGRLLGPINRRVYASFAPKRHAFEIARREANKRGFCEGSGKIIQIVTDGDDDLAVYAKQFFPEARHTVDVMHVIEYVYQAASAIHREGSDELAKWVKTQKSRLYGGREAAMVRDMKRHLDAIPITGPGNKGRRERLTQAINYIDKRLPNMNYKALLDQDLELGSGAVEGAVKNIIGARFDQGGSRWIRERAEALLQLRCMDKNGDFDAFIQWVHDDCRSSSLRDGQPVRVQQKVASPLPELAEAA